METDLCLFVVVTCRQGIVVQGALECLGKAGGVDDVVRGVPSVQQGAVRWVHQRRAAAARQHQHHLGPGRLAQDTLYFDIEYTIFKAGSSIYYKLASKQVFFSLKWDVCLQRSLLTDNFFYSQIFAKIKRPN